MMRKLAILAALIFLGSTVSAQVKVNGAGASGAAPVFASWSKAFSTRGGAAVEYASSNSLTGVEAVKRGEADFALSEARISISELQKFDLVQFPVLVEGVVAVYNLPTVASLRLTGTVIADIYLGKITTWDDAAIRALNPTVALPGSTIRALHREAESGTSFLFTSYLSAASPEWKAKVGAGAAVKWPHGETPAKPGSDGMADQVASTPGALGYVGFPHANKRKLGMAQLQNRSSQWVAPSPEGFAAAATSVDWSQAPTFSVIIVDQPGAATWPISGVCFAVAKRIQTDPAKGRAMLQFFEYAFNEGGVAASEIGYVPVPAPIVKVVREAWPHLLKSADGVSLFSGAMSR
jgi:phosphate transport system substrate-binding protein